MPRITKVYTRTGDDGTTGLGSGRPGAGESIAAQVKEGAARLVALLPVGVLPVAAWLGIVFFAIRASLALIPSRHAT